MVNAAYTSLDAQINDYLLTASGHLKESKSCVAGRQVAAFAAAVSSGLAMMSQAEASIVHNAGSARPVSPGSNQSANFASFDIDGDNQPDFRLGADSSSGWLTARWTGGPSSNSAVGNGDLRKVSSGQIINASGASGVNWLGCVQGECSFISESSGDSNWNGSNGETGLAAVKLKIGGNTHFGWVRIHIISGGDSVYAEVTEWAYESCPNTAIVAGQASGGATCGPTAVPVMTPLAYGLTSLALGSLGLAGLRRRRAARQAEPTRH